MAADQGSVTRRTLGNKTTAGWKANSVHQQRQEQRVEMVTALGRSDSQGREMHRPRHAEVD